VIGSSQLTLLRASLSKRYAPRARAAATPRLTAIRDGSLVAMLEGVDVRAVAVPLALAAP